MRTLLAILLMAAAAGSAAAPPHKYAVLSLIGDRIMFVERVPPTETQPEQSLIDYLDLPEKVFDKTALVAANTVLERVDRGSKAVLLDARDPTLYSAQAQILEPGGAGADLLKPLLAASKATHLILITRLRHEAMLDAGGGHVGSGMLEGLGFYIDRTKPLAAANTGAIAYGYLGPFAYFQISVFDIAGKKVVRREQITASKTLSAARSPTLDPWTTLTAADKVVVLQDLITREIALKLPRLVGSVF